MEQHRLVIIGSKDENVELIKRAKKRNYYVIVCDGYDKSKIKELADKTYDINVRDVDAIAKMCIAERADGIIGSFSDVVFEQITCIADKANLRWYAKPNILDYYRDKYKQKNLLQQLGVKVPKFAIIDKSNYSEVMQSITYPVVIKPVNGWGSRDITVIDTARELKDYISELSDDVKYEIEEYCEAFEYNCISWVVDGKVNILGISDRERNPRTGNRIATLNRIVYPSKKYEEVKSKAASVLQRFIDVTGQKEGPLSIQFFYRNNEIVVVEIAGRVLGHEHDLIKYCGGADVKEMLLDYVYDSDKIKEDIVDMNGTDIACGIYFICKNGSIMKDISRVIPMFEKYQVDDYEIFGEEGCEYSPSYPYLAKCYFTGTSREELDVRSKKMYEEMFVGDDKNNNIIVPFVLEQGRI